MVVAAGSEAGRIRARNGPTTMLLDGESLGRDTWTVVGEEPPVLSAAEDEPW